MCEAVCEREREWESTYICWLMRDWGEWMQYTVHTLGVYEYERIKETDEVFICFIYAHCYWTNWYFSFSVRNHTQTQTEYCEEVRSNEALLFCFTSYSFVSRIQMYRNGCNSRTEKFTKFVAWKKEFITRKFSAILFQSLRSISVQKNFFFSIIQKYKFIGIKRKTPKQKRTESAKCNQ